MTPEERRKRVEYVAKMAEQGLLAEPAYDREAWRAQHEAGDLPPVAPPANERRIPQSKAARRRTA